jgi:dihydroorotate dehydrogenase (NAD+) catalytic subunit
VYEVARRHNVPIIGQGGITSANDALEFLIAGATTVGVGTALFYDPLVCRKINDGIAAYLAKHNLQSVAELIGTSSAHPPLELDAVGRASARQKESG